MNRRGFLSLLMGTAATATLDPERLLWLPGKKLISVPALVPELHEYVSVADTIAAQIERVRHEIEVVFEINPDVFRRLYSPRWRAA